MPSEIVGTAALWVGLLAATLVAISQRPTASRLSVVVNPALLVLALQSLHFAEEYTTAFYRLFPERLGLTPWSAEFFVVFNASWLAIWLLAVWAASSKRAPVLAATALWFLAFAAIGNGIAHPVLAFMAQGYFPGLVTSPFLGITGILLLRSLSRRSDTSRS